MEYFFNVSTIDGMARTGILRSRVDKKKRQLTPVFIPRIHGSLLKNDFYINFIKNTIEKRNVEVLITNSLFKTEHEIFKEKIESILKHEIILQELTPGDLESNQNIVNTAIVLKPPFPSYSIGEDFSKVHLASWLKAIKNYIEAGNEAFGISLRDHGYPSILKAISESDWVNGFNSILFENLDIHARDINSLVKKSRAIFQDFRLDLLRLVKTKSYHHEFPSLVSGGMDAIIENGYLASAGKGLYFTTGGMERIENLRELPCNCPSCEFLMEHDHRKLDTFEKALHLYIHDMNEAMNEMARIRNALQRNTFREYLEFQSQSSVHLTVFRKKLDVHSKDIFISSANLGKKAKVDFIGTGAYHRPDVVKFRHKVKRHFTFPERTEYVVLLPCSARKPYIESSSHGKFHRAMRSGWKKWFRYCSEMIITSPIGVIPRQLERCFPAAHYDVPVTGYWDEQELEFSRDMIVSIIKQNIQSGMKLRGIIAHLDGGYRKACELAEPFLKVPVTYTGNFESVTRENALDALREEFYSIQATLEPNLEKETMNKTKAKLEDYKILANFQFETNLGDALIYGSPRIRKNRRNTTLIIDGETKTNIFSQDASTGYIKLERLGMERAWNGHLEQKDIQLKTVEFNGDSLRGSNLFPAGIEKADGTITVGDDVFIHDGNNHLLGYGRAIVPGHRMLEMHSGPVVYLLDKIKK